METTKAYTDIEQSKKLAEILPLESADMYWWYSGKRYYIEAIDDGDFNENSDIRAWSLAALLDVLPNNENISTNLSKGGYRISTLEYTNSWFVDYEDEINGLNNCVASAGNPVDACVEMIMRLKEKGLL